MILCQWNNDIINSLWRKGCIDVNLCIFSKISRSKNFGSSKNKGRVGRGGELNRIQLIVWKFSSMVKLTKTNTRGLAPLAMGMMTLFYVHLANVVLISFFFKKIHEKRGIYCKNPVGDDSDWNCIHCLKTHWEYHGLVWTSWD